ncbi:hypothetical protein Barb6_01835 [Bacteroidales bacterium Barb6]|nr:hypothetical protein Barb6_01835 [Bacteroidales bacterium Barb6]OAV70558.1 hypothetical protein Barb4_01283 [Bacteroidales bacterium Barb4]
MLNEILNLAAKVVGASTDTSNLQTILYAVLNSVMGLGSIICIIFIAVAGVRLSKATEEEDMANAKKHIKNAIIGLCICVLALVVGNAVIATAHT